MLSIIISIAIMILIHKNVEEEDNAFSLFICIIFDLFIAFIGIFCIGIFGLFMPTEYGQWEVVQQTELVPLSNNTEGEGLIYASVSSEKVYTYRYEISTSDVDTARNYITDTISEAWTVIEREDMNCKVPLLILEERKQKKPTIWSFRLGSEWRYVFYVPEETIRHEGQLN